MNNQTSVAPMHHSLALQTSGAVQVIQGTTTGDFDHQQPFVLMQVVPFSPAVPGTDMGDQHGGRHYLQRSGSWSQSWRGKGAARYSREVAEKYRQQMTDSGLKGVQIVDANVLAARLHVMLAVSRLCTEGIEGADYLERCSRLEAISDERFAEAAKGLALDGMLSDPFILGVSGLDGSALVAKASTPATRPYLVTVRLFNGENAYHDCDAETEADARQKVGWAYVREGVVTNVRELDAPAIIPQAGESEVASRTPAVGAERLLVNVDQGDGENVLVALAPDGMSEADAGQAVRACVAAGGDYSDLGARLTASGFVVFSRFLTVDIK